MLAYANQRVLVHCAHHSIRPQPLSSTLSLTGHANQTPNGTSYTLPFQNINSRAVVRVIDFFPRDLADFAVVCRKVSEYDILTDQEDSDSRSDRSYSSLKSKDEQRWEWRFALVLEDALESGNDEKATLAAYVADQDAEFLLKMEAAE